MYKKGRIEDLTDDEQEIMSSCGIIMSVADSGNIPEIFEKKKFDPQANKKDIEFQASLFALLPAAVRTILEYAQALQKEMPAMNVSGHLSPGRTAKVGRNDPCPCGTGKKYKKCCGMKEQ